jgi:hypothetical protein
MRTFVESMILSLSFANGFAPRKAVFYRTLSALLVQRSKSQMDMRQGSFWQARMDGWRPTLNDVERISFGKPAKQKGTGSRGVPHRLNEDERFLFDQARRKGYLEIGGSGWRSQRRDAPLLNSYRSLCDARGQSSIVLHKMTNGSDELVVDLSPLRNPDAFDQIAKQCLQQYAGGQIVFPEVGTNQMDLDAMDDADSDNDDSAANKDEQYMWENRPIYQIPPYRIVFELPRPDAKVLCKLLAETFDTAEGKIAPSKKPTGIKPGKSRQHGGYGIG